jgi:alpha/beta superfamily hydrolase
MDAEVGSPTPLTITSEEGVTLEAQYWLPEDAWATVVLSHPHPQYGGDMHNPLIDELIRSLPAAGIATLRYNFRGVGGSTGSHGSGVAERLDAAAAFRQAVELGVDGPLVSCGWSFGADVSLASDDASLGAWIGIAAPLAIVDPSEMVAPNDARPTLLLVPEHDQFRTPDSAAEASAGWTSTTLVTIPGGDHFLMGRAAAVAEQVVEFVRGL